MSKDKCEDWVSEVNLKKYFRIEQTIGELENDVFCRDAASTLFWQSYFELKKLLEFREFLLEIDRKLDGIRISDELREKFRDDLIKLYIRDIKFREPELLNRINEIHKQIDRTVGDIKSENEITSIAFVQLHLVTILLRAIHQQSWGSPELTDDLISSGKRAFSYIAIQNDLYSGSLLSERKAHQMLRRQGYIVVPALPDETHVEISPETTVSPLDKQKKESLSAVISLFLNEVFIFEKANGDYQVALAMFSLATAMWSASNSTMTGELIMQEAVDCFEHVLALQSGVKDWDDIANACSQITDQLSTYPESEDLSSDTDVRDNDGWPQRAITYWQRACTLSENKLSPDALVQVRDKEKLSLHRNRLEVDFLGPLFEVLEKESRKALIQEEINWYDSESQGGRPTAAANELRLVFEHELRATIFNKISNSLNSILNDGKSQDKLYGLGIRSKQVAKLNLTEMAILLKNSNTELLLLPMKLLIDKFQTGVKDREFLYVELPDYIGDLMRSIRNLAEHPDSKTRENILGKLGGKRRTALGIGCEGYIGRLLSIKKANQNK